MEPAVGVLRGEHETQVLLAQVVQLGPGFPAGDDQRPGDVVEAVAVLPARGDALRVLVQPAGVGEPAQVREHRGRHVEVAAHETRARPLATSPAATAR